MTEANYLGRPLPASDHAFRASAAPSPKARITSVGAALGSVYIDVSEVTRSWGSATRPGSATIRVCADDEDSLTLAWQAGTAALDAARWDLSTGPAQRPTSGLPIGVWWGTSRPPFGEGPSHSYLVASLGLPEDTAGTLITGSVHAGMDALLAAMDAIAAGSVTSALVVASDAVLPGTGTAVERATGAGAAAFLLEPEAAGPDGVTSLIITIRASRSVPILDRYRGEAQPEVGDLYDPRLFREAVFLPSVESMGRALEEARESAGAAAIGTWVLPDPDGRLGTAAAKRLGVPAGPTRDLFRVAGDTGAVAPLLGLAVAIATPGSPGATVVISYGGGRTSGLLLEPVSAAAVSPISRDVPGSAEVRSVVVPRRPDAPTATYAEVLRSRAQLVAMADPVPMGVPPASAGSIRGTAEVLRREGAKCRSCGWTSIPPTIHPACVNCGATTFDAVRLGRTGVVHTFVVNQTMPAPFTAPLPLVVVDLDEGSRVMLQGISACAASLEIGQRAHLVLRRYALERGAPVYGYKVAPAPADSPGTSVTGPRSPGATVTGLADHGSKEVRT